MVGPIILLALSFTNRLVLKILTILQMDCKMVQTALPQDREYMERGNYHNMQLPDRMESARTVKIMETSAVICLGFSAWSRDVASNDILS